MLTIILATLIPSSLSAMVISIIPATILSKMGRSLSLVATGLLLTLALTHLLPEALEEGSDIHTIGLTIWSTIMVLIGLEMFFNSHHEHDTCPVCMAHEHLKNRRHSENDFGVADHDSHCTGACRHSKLKINKLIGMRAITSQGPLNLSQIDPSLAHESKAAIKDFHSPLHHFSTIIRFHLHGQDIEHTTSAALNNEKKGRSSFYRALSNGGAPILMGTLFHAVCDGVVIVSSFMIDVGVGVAVSAAILGHELPQQLSNYVLMLNFGMSRLQGYCVNLVSALGALIGGTVFYVILDQAEEILPYALAMAGGSFIYVALADILPRLNKHGTKVYMLRSFMCLCLGACIAMLLSHHH